MKMFQSDLWTNEQPTPESTKGEMFIWAYRWGGEWKVGLAYWTVTRGHWADAYGSSVARDRATWFHPMPIPPGQ